MRSVFSIFSTRGRAALLGLALALTASVAAQAQEAAIRKNFAERLPNMPAIDEVNKTPIPGIYEVRLGGELVYADESGNQVRS